MNEQMQRLYLAAKQLKGITGKSEVAALLGQLPQTLKAWENRGISNEGILIAYEKIGCDPLWLKHEKGDMLLVESPPLTKLQKDWLSLLDGLIDEDIAEFSSLVETRRQRNYKISNTLSGKQNSSLQPEQKLTDDKADKLREIFASSNDEQKRLVEMAIQLMQTDQEALKRHTG